MNNKTARAMAGSYAGALIQRRVILAVLFFSAAFYEKPSILIFDTSLWGVNFAFKPVYVALAGAVFFILGSAREHYRYLCSRIKEDLPCYLFLFLTVFFLVQPEFFGAGHSKNTFIVFIVNFTLAIVVSLLIRDSRDAMVAFWALSIGVLVYSSLLREVFFYPFWSRSVHRSQFGLGLSFVTIINFCLLLYALVSKKNPLTVLCGIVAPLQILFLVADRSKISWTATVVSLFFICFFLVRNMSTLSRHLMVKLIATLIILLSIFLSIVFARPVGKSSLEQIVTLVSETPEFGYEDPFVASMDEGLIKRSLTNLSYARTGSWRLVFQEYLEEIVFVGKGINFHVPPRGVHNSYFKVLISAGILGLISFFLFIFFAVRRVYRKFITATDMFEMFFFLATIGALISWIICGITDTFLEQFTIWALFGFALVDLEKKRGRENTFLE